MNKTIAERILHTIDMLGCGLADHQHVWSSVERSEYEKTVRLLLSIIR